MFLNEVHEQLCSAEFSLLSIGDGDVLKAEQVPKINAIIQAGINDLNKKFSILEKEILITTKLGKEVYELVPSNAVSAGAADAFIQDTQEDPFLGDIMQILRVTDVVGNSMWLNTDVPRIGDTENVFGIRPNVYSHQGINLTAYNTLKLNKDSLGCDLLIKYKAKMPQLNLSLPADQVHISLPDHYLNALVLYVASRYYNPKGAETIGRGMFHEGNNYWSKYQEECQDLRNSLGSIGSIGEVTNFEKGGWV